MQELLTAPEPGPGTLDGELAGHRPDWVAWLSWQALRPLHDVPFASSLPGTCLAAGSLSISNLVPAEHDLEPQSASFDCPMSGHCWGRGTQKKPWGWVVGTNGHSLGAIRRTNNIDSRLSLLAFALWVWLRSHDTQFSTEFRCLRRCPVS